MNTDKKLTPEENLMAIIKKHIPNGCVNLKSYGQEIGAITKCMKEYGQQEREFQKKEDDLAIHAAYNYGYKRGKKEANEWILVEDKLPETGGTKREFNVCSDSLSFSSNWSGVNKRFEDHEGEPVKVKIIGWQPLPAPPQQGKEGDNGTGN